MKNHNNKHGDLAGLLGTRNRDQQAAKVQQLIQAAGAPVVDVFIRYDARTGQVLVGTIGGQVDPAAIYKILDMGRDALRQKELDAARVAPAGIDPPP